MTDTTRSITSAVRLHSAIIRVRAVVISIIRARMALPSTVLATSSSSTIIAISEALHLTEVKVRILLLVRSFPLILS